MKFKQAGQYVNMSRVEPSLFTKITTTAPWGEKMRFNADPTTTFPIGIMIVQVEDCQVIKPGFVAIGDGWHVRRIIGLPFNIIWDYDLEVWGTVFGFERIMAPVSIQGIQFSSQGEIKGIFLFHLLCHHN